MSALEDVIQYHADNCQSGSECDLSGLSRAELTKLRRRVETLEQTQLDHENDCSVLPENVSVTEYVTKLRTSIAELEAALTSIATTTGSNGHTASNIVRYANEVLNRYHTRRDISH